jgi:LppM domain
MTHRRILGALGLGALTVLLSACVKLDMNLTVHSNDTVSGSVIAGVSKQVLPALGGEQAVRDQVQQLLSENELPAGVEITNYGDNTYSGIKATFDDLALDEVNTRLASRTQGPLIKHENGQFIVDTTLPLTGDAFGLGDLGVAAGTGDIRIVVTFPGRVLSHNGQLDGTTVTWRGTLGQDLVMQAVSEDSGAEAVSGSNGGGMVALWIGLAALLAAGLVGFFLYRRSRRAPAAATTGSQDTTGTIADYDEPVAGSVHSEPTTQEYGTREYAVPAAADPPVESGSDADTSTTAALSDVGEAEAPPADPPAGGKPPESRPQPPAGSPPAGQPPESAAQP